MNLFSQLASLVRSVLYFIKEHRVIESKTETYRMCWLHLITGDVHGILICILRLSHNICSKTITAKILGMITRNAQTEHKPLLRLCYGG